MKKLIWIVLLSVLNIAAYGQKSEKLSLDPQKAEWFKEAKFGLFMHWGLYSILEGSYNGRTLPDTTLAHGRSWYAEWIQPRLEVPMEEYKALIHRFNPVKYNAEEWVREAKNAGMRYIVITAKHHDGFALWNSDVSDFDIMNTPYKKDVIEALVKACRKYGMKYGFYYSHWQDWEYPGGALPHWMPKVDDARFQKYWEKKSLQQVKELIVKYDPDLLWFDTWDEETHITPERRDELIRLVRKYSDKCLINGRICYLNPGENIDFLEMHDNAYPEHLIDKPWQTPATMQHSWGYHAKDYNWKSAEEMLGYLVSNASKGGNYLLNIGPKADGTFPLPAIRRLREMGAWMLVNGEAVYGTQPVDMKAPEGTCLTQKTENGHRYLYLFLKKRPAEVFLPVTPKGDCTVLETGRPVEMVSEKGGVRLILPAEIYRGGGIQVLKIMD